MTKEKVYIMNTKTITIYPFVFCILFILNGCELDLLPYDGLPSEETFSSVEGIKAATLGTYAILKESDSADGYYKMKENPGDNVSMSGIVQSHWYLTLSYRHVVDQSNVLGVWTNSYKVIYSTNNVIENVAEGHSEEIDQLIGENLYLRAYAHFRLVTLFGRPYPQGATNLGVPIVDRTDIVNPARDTVGEVYDFIIADLEEAASLMTMDKSSIFATREAAYALLSRVFLYMEENEKAIEYSDLVINSGRYALVDTETLKIYPTIVPENNPETIFAIRFTQSDDLGQGAYGSQLFTSPEGAGWGATYASEAYRNILDQYPEDARRTFIQPDYALDENGNRIVGEDDNFVVLERNGFPKYFVIKMAYQDGNSTLWSPIVSRLAEIYLNRAEALAKIGEDSKAIDDVNTIRERAGLSGGALYSISDLKGHDSVLDVVLEERRLELAFEGHRAPDVFRNNRTMNRDYPGTHQTFGISSVIIPPDHPRVVHFIPEREIILNPNLVQNP